MDPVSLHGERRGGDGEVEDRDSVAAIGLEVTLSAIPDSYSDYNDLVKIVEKWSFERLVYQKSSDRPHQLLPRCRHFATWLTCGFPQRQISTRARIQPLCETLG